MAVHLSVIGNAFQFFNTNGRPLSLGALYTYAAGTTTPQTTYSDSAGSVPNANPIALDSSGRVNVEVWLTDGQAYKFVLKDSGGSTIGTYDNITGIGDPTVLSQLAASTGAALVGSIDSLSGAVARTVQAKLRDFVSVKDFGATGDGSTDDTSAIQTALNTLSAGTGTGNRAIYFPAGTYKISSSLLPPNSASHFTLYGDGYLASQLSWSGAAGSPMLKLRNSREATIRDMAFVGNAGAKPSAGIEVNRTGSQVGAPAPTGCRFLGLEIGGSAANSVGSGILYTCDAGQDTNNDDGYFQNVRVSNATNYGIAFQHLNSLIHTLVGCSFLNCLTAAVSNVGGANSSQPNIGGSFSAFSCASSGCGATLELNGATHAIGVTNWQSESDSKILTTPFTVGTTYRLNLTLTGFDWIGLDGTAITFDAGVGSSMTVVGGHILAPSNLTISCPTTGSKFNVFGGYFGVTTFTYKNEVFLYNAYIDAATPTFTNSGGGTMRALRSDGTTSSNTIPVITSGTTFLADPNTANTWYLAYVGATNLSTITGGVPGDLITLYANNANATIVHGTGANAIELNASVNFAMGAGATLTLRRHDATNNNRWVECGRRVP